jgi:phage terminase large subunit-like protein
MRRQDKEAKERYLRKLEFIRSAACVGAFETPEQKQQAIQRATVDIKFLVQRYFAHYATAECAPFQIEWAEMLADDPCFTGFAKWGRGLAKSVWNNIIIPFWLWLRERKKYLVIIAVNEKKAVRLLEDLKAEFECNPQIIADFGEQKNPGSWGEELWITRGGFIGQALGFGQSVRGLRVREKRPDHFSLDDLETRETIKNPKRQDEMVEWVEQELLPAMDGDTERLVFCNNWFAPVMFLRKLHELHPDWVVHEVRAYDPVTYLPAWSKYSKEYYRQKEMRMGVVAARAEYNHEAKPRGKIFKPEQIQWALLPKMNGFKIIIGHWDVAYSGTESADYNAVRVWGLRDSDFFYINSYVKQSKMREAVFFMCQFQRQLPKTVFIHWQYESQFWNAEVDRTIREVQTAHGVVLNITRVDTPRIKKYDRILSLQPYYQNSRIFYNDRLKSHADTQTGLMQLYGIEPGYSGHDDAPDADEQAIRFLEKHISTGTTGGSYKAGKVKRINEAI